jgi:hypothetical protein
MQRGRPGLVREVRLLPTPRATKTAFQAGQIRPNQPQYEHAARVPGRGIVRSVVRDSRRRSEHKPSTQRIVA